MKHALSSSVVFFILAFITKALIAADRIEIFPLKHRTANEVIPIIQPMLGKGTAVTGQGFNLIIRAPAASLEQARDLVARLDRSPRRLRISVRKQRTGAIARQDIKASGVIRSGNTRIQLNDAAPAGLQLHESIENSPQDSTQSVHTIEGRQAFIQVGQLVPVPERSIDSFGNQRQSIDYKNATTGFYVLPRLSGDQVILDISPHSIAIGKHGQHRFDIQRAQTTLRGKIGEWLSIGGIHQQRHSGSKGTAYTSRRRDGLNSDFQLRVDIIAE
jgi:hypothetical protein